MELRSHEVRLAKLVGSLSVTVVKVYIYIYIYIGMYILNKRGRLEKSTDIIGMEVA